MSTPIQLITGFLGSGKSTFLNFFLNNCNPNKKIAIIQNEFSPLNIDGKKLLQTNKYEVLEINNGSVFCVCLLGSFIESLSAFREQVNPDLIIMETSGLSDTIGVGQVFQSEKLKGIVYLDHVWCIVDAQNFNRIPSLNIRFQHQLKSADTIVVNKIDLVNDDIELIVEELKKVNPFAHVEKAQFGKIDLNTPRKALNIFPARNEISLGRPGLESIVIKSSQPIKKADLFEFLNKYCQGAIRCKGFIKFKDCGYAFIQGVFEDMKIEEISPFPGPTEFILIGNFDKEKNLQVIFDEYCRL